VDRVLQSLENLKFIALTYTIHNLYLENSMRIELGFLKVIAALNTLDDPYQLINWDIK